MCTAGHECVCTAPACSCITHIFSKDTSPCHSCAWLFNYTQICVWLGATMHRCR